MSVTRPPATRNPPINAGSRILLLSAYDAHSHRQWRNTLCDMFPEYHWTCLTLPPRHFAWRVRGNSLTWAFNHRQTLTDNHDLLIVTSLTDLSTLRGFVPALARLPTLVYFHENQFAYPPAPERHGTQQDNKLNAQMINFYTALCADRIVFNSDWNRRSFFDGLDALLKKLPDQVPEGLSQNLQKISSVLAVPLPDHLFDNSARQISDTRHFDRGYEVVQIVWNHRHEYDKGPALLLAIVQRLVTLELPFRLHLLGQRFRSEPDEFSTIRALLAVHCSRLNVEPGLDQWLPARDDYEAVLTQCDIALSTALHDFQGLSVLEAAAKGCVPLAPAALAYPEYIASACLYSVAGLTVEQQAANACTKIINWRQAWQQTQVARPAINVSQYSAAAMHRPWAALLASLAATASAT